MIGSGYVGLTSGACLAKVGHDVICVDNDAQRIEILKEKRGKEGGKEGEEKRDTSPISGRCQDAGVSGSFGDTILNSIRGTSRDMMEDSRQSGSTRPPPYGEFPVTRWQVVVTRSQPTADSLRQRQAGVGAG